MVVNELPLNMLSCVSCFTQRRKDGGGPGLLQLKGFLREGAALFVEKSGSGFKKILFFFYERTFPEESQPHLASCSLLRALPVF